MKRPWQAGYSIAQTFVRISSHLCKQKLVRHGTPVTIETFLSWADKIQKPFLEARKRRDQSQRPTGKQLFEADASLATSDVALAGAADAEVLLQSCDPALCDLAFCGLGPVFFE